LPAYGVSGPAQTTKRIYGNRGNSFVAVVEFGPRVQAKTLLAGGVSGDPASPHFNDQATRYAAGQFKDAWFYRADIEKNAKRTYHPGQPK
jgi:acyl-homoserine-lactone acylase